MFSVCLYSLLRLGLKIKKKGKGTWLSCRWPLVQFPVLGKRRVRIPKSRFFPTSLQVWVWSLLLELFALFAKMSFCFFWMFFLVHLSFPLLQVMGLVHQRCPGHRHFPAMLQNRVKRLSHRCHGPAAMDSAIAPASFNDTLSPPMTSKTVCPGPAMGSFLPPASWKTNCSTI